jgi:hypothetical protein
VERHGISVKDATPSNWNGEILKKHVVSVQYSEDRPPSTDAEVDISVAGYFIVTFDEGENDDTQHRGGTYVYAATRAQVREWEKGDLDVKEFYKW